MKIRKLKLKNYRKFSELELNFDSGINIIVGDNEAGKSTISQAIMDLFYLDPTTKAQNIHVRMKSWGQSNLPVIDLIFNSDGDDYQFTKDFNAKSLILKNLSNNKKSENYKDSLAYMKNFTGISNESVYKKTAFINQGDIAWADSSDDLLHEITSGTKEGSNSGAQQVIKKLKSELSNLNKGVDRPASSPGPIKAEQIRIEKLTNYLEEKKSAWEKKKTASTKKEESSEELIEVKNRLEKLEKMIANYQIAKQAGSQLKEIEAQIAQLERKIAEFQSLNKKEDELKAEMKKFSKFENSNIDNDIREIAGYEQSIKRLESELQKVGKSQDMSQSNLEISKKNDSKLRSGGKLPLAISIIAGLITGAVLYLLNMTVFVAFITAFIFALITYVVIKLLFKQASNDERDVKTDPLEEITKNLENSINVETKKLNSLITKYNVKDASDFYSLKAEYMSLKTRLSDTKNQMNILLGDSNFEKIVNIQRSLMIKKKEIETTVLTEEVLNSKMSAEEYYDRSTELKDLGKKKVKLEEELVASRTRAGDASVEYSDIVTLQEEIEGAKKQMEALIRRKKILELAVNTMEETVEEVAKSSNTLLSRTIEAHLPGITNSRYQKVRVSKDLKVQVHSDEKKDWVDPIQELSRGTIDQIYFLARIGFIKLITGNKSIPIILDDPFVTADSVRKENIRVMVEQYSRQYQVLLFTNDSDYAEWGNIISLR